MVGQARRASAYRDGTGKVNLTDPNRKQQIKYGHEHFQISSTDSILYVRSFIAIGWDCMIAKRILVLIHGKNLTQTLPCGAKKILPTKSSIPYLLL